MYQFSLNCHTVSSTNKIAFKDSSHWQILQRVALIDKFLYNSTIYSSKQTYIKMNEEEGFFTDQPTLQHVTVNINLSTRPTDLQPRYVNLHGFIKRQPTQVIETSSSCQVLYSSTQNKYNSEWKPKHTEIQPQTLQQYFKNTATHQHIYSRYGKIDNSRSFQCLSENMLSLNHLNQYFFDDYSILKQHSFPSSVDHERLEFDSKFEGGNLAHAFYNKQTKQYQLVMQNDVNTNGYNQWFYFSVTGMRRGASYVFNILNFVSNLLYSQRKNSSLFQLGMLPTIYSFERKGWFRGGRNIRYMKSELVDNCISNQKYYKLTFSLIGQEKLMVATGMPYSYTKLIKSLRNMESKCNEREDLKFDIGIAGYTICNNAVPVVTVSSSSESNQDQNKRIIVITSRQHSGETWSSFLCQNILWQLIENPKSKDILKKYIFKVYPMINVDGVIYGNFRCDVGGVDLNRRWKQPCKFLQPHIFSIKESLSKLNEIRQIDMYIDLHGHSKKMNSFCYCCDLNSNSRILPLTINNLTPLFSFKDCTFGLQKSKSKTSRGFMFELCQKVNVLTIQCSAFGHNYMNKNTHFQPQDMKALAQALVVAIWINITEQTYKGINRTKITNEISSRLDEFTDFDKNNQNDSGSDSDPEREELNESEKNKIIPKKLIKMLNDQQQKQIKQAEGKKKIKKRSKKQQRNSIKSNPKLLIVQKKEVVIVPEQKTIVPISRRQPIKVTRQKQRQRSVPAYKQYSSSQQKVLRFKPVVISKTPMPDKSTYLSKVIETINIKSRIQKRKQKEVMPPATHTFEAKATIQFPVLRRRTLTSEGQYEQPIKQTKSFVIRKQHKIPQVRMFNQRLLKASTNQKGLCLISQTKQLQHIGRKQHRSRRQSCTSNPYYSSKKKDVVINFQKYKNKQRNKSSLLNQVSKLWKFHVQKYTKELQYNM